MPGVSEAPFLEATTLAHTLFRNQGDHFQALPLHPQTQQTPAFSPLTADLNLDRKEDLFLAQNFFATPLGTPRSDAGRGLWLTGNGPGGFTPVSGSGVAVYGEQRGAAATDYDGDGRLDMVVSQNGRETKLYRGIGGVGLRVRLVGPVGNRWGVGSVLRVRYGGGEMGAARLVGRGVEVVSGAGAEGVWVRWPDGRETEAIVEAGAAEVIVRYEE